MFKRPRGNKDTEVVGLQRMTKRLKEDTGGQEAPRYRVHREEDYINVTFPRKINDSSQHSNISMLQEQPAELTRRKISDSSLYSNVSILQPAELKGQKISNSSQYSNVSVLQQGELTACKISDSSQYSNFSEQPAELKARKVSDSSQYSNVSMLLPVELTDTTESQEQLHYNRLKLQHQQGNSKYEIKMMQYASQCDSDNSSTASEMMTDASSEPDAQESREREHYNKLKVDLKNIKSNKKLLKGIQVLNQRSLFNGAIASSILLQSRQRVAGTSTPPLHYKKEGHTNRLHSVAQSKVFSLLTPTQSPTSFHKSRSTGDILEMGREQQFPLELKVDMPSRHQPPTRHQLQLNLPHSQSTYNMEADTASRHRPQFKLPLSQSVYNLDTDDPHLTQFKPQSISNTRAKKSSAHGSHLKLPQLHLSQSVSNLDTDNKPSTRLLPHSVSVQNMEADTHTTHQRLQLQQSLSVHNVGRDRPSSRLRHTQVSPLTLNQQLPKCHHASTQPAFMSKVISFACTHEGREIHSASYDFTVNIPKGTIRKRKSVDFQVGVCTRGPFVFPKGYKLVSPIIMVTCSSLTKLKKPIQIVLSHCMDLVRQGEENVTFFRAKKMDRKGRSQNPYASDKYYMEATESSCNHFQLHNQHGNLTSTELGFFCILSREHTGTRKHTNYCVVPVVPKSVETSWKVHYCVTYHLKAFVKVRHAKYIYIIIQRMSLTCPVRLGKQIHCMLILSLI